MKILELDIETAPNKVYAWGLWNQNIGINQIVEPGYTLCWAAKWYGQKGVEFNSVHHDGEEIMLNRIWELMNEADAIVHYNGNKFDIPTLNAEFVKLGWEPPNPSHHIDLYRVVRQRFRLPSNKLDYVAQVLGLGKKHSHKGMDLWTECMAGDDKAWKQMRTYNIQDVVLLEALYTHLLPWIKNHPNHGLYIDEDTMVCTNCGSSHIQKNGVEHTTTMSYQRYRCGDCKTPLKGRTNILTKEKKANIILGSKL